MFQPSCIKLKMQSMRANSVDPDEVAHYELPYSMLLANSNIYISWCIY